MLQKSSNVCATDFKNSPKWPNFAKSGNTGLKWVWLYFKSCEWDFRDWSICKFMFVLTVSSLYSNHTRPNQRILTDFVSRCITVQLCIQQHCYIKINNKLSRHSSMVSSAPTILQPRVRIPSTPSTLFSICIEIVRKERKLTERGRDWPIFLKKIKLNYLNPCKENDYCSLSTQTHIGDHV